MATATAEALSDAAREFVAAGPHKLLIGGERLEAADGRTFATIDPATGEPICEVAQAGAEDVDRAVAAARAALEGPLRKVSPSKRAGLMYTLAELIKANGDELAELESLDNGKPLAAAKGDVAASVAHLRYYAGWPTKIEGETIPVSARDLFCYTLREPVGVCAQIVPWNFPLLMAVWKISPALAAGCPLILKPAEQTPLTALRLGELALEAGFPEGTVNVLTGDGETGAALVDHPGVDKVAFTGSTAVGREIGAKCGRALKRVTLELGGKSPNIILPDADLEAAVKGSFQGIYYNSGQACNAASRLFVQAEIFDEVVEKLAEFASRGEGRPRARPRDAVRAADLRGAARPRHRLHRLRARRGRRGGRRRHARQRRERRLLRRPDPVHRRLRRDEDRPRGDLRPGAGRAAVRGPGGGRPARQRHRVRARRRPLDARHLQRPQARRAAAGRIASTSTPGAPATRRSPSAATRPRGSGARRATTTSTPTSRPSRSSPSSERALAGGVRERDLRDCDRAAPPRTVRTRRRRRPALRSGSPVRASTSRALSCRPSPAAR